MIPKLTKLTRAGKETVDLLSHDFESRKLWLFGLIDDETAVTLISQLEYLDQNGTEDIKLYINSGGGDVSAGFAIVDAMDRCQCDVVTVCTGMAASTGALLLSCGAKGKRYATPLSEVMIHQPVGGVQGPAADIQRAADHIGRTRQRIYALLAENTGRSVADVAADCDRDHFMTAREAIQYGLVDELLTSNRMLE